MSFFENASKIETRYDYILNSLSSIYLKMDTIKVHECFSVIHDICTASKVNPDIYYGMLKRIIECKAVRGTDIATVFFDTQDDWITCLENGGYTMDEIYKLHDMFNEMYYYLGTDDDYSVYSDDDSDDLSSDEDDYDDDSGESESDDDQNECSDKNVFNMLVNQLGEDNKTNTQLAWIAGYVTATVFHKKMMKNT